MSYWDELIGSGTIGPRGQLPAYAGGGPKRAGEPVTDKELGGDPDIHGGHADKGPDPVRPPADPNAEPAPQEADYPLP